MHRLEIIKRWWAQHKQVYQLWGERGLACLLGVCTVWPWSGAAWQDWQTAREAESLAAMQRQEAQALQNQTEQIWQAHRALVLTPDVQALSASLVTHGMVVTDIAMGRAVTDSHAAALQIVQVPMRVSFETSWSQWQAWWRQMPTQIEGATLEAADIKPTKAGRMTVHATLNVPHVGDVRSSLLAKDHSGSEDAAVILMDAQSWQAAQQAYAQQHDAMTHDASAPQRDKTPLEFFNRAQLQYVGVMGWGNALQALVRVNDPHAMTSLYRVSVGDYLGKDAGRIRRIDSDALVVDEWVKDAAGQWRSQEIRMALWTGATR
jgi:Tfp pilus assembly protein PilP